MYLPFAVFMALFIPFVAMTVLFMLYSFFLCLGVVRLRNNDPPRPQPQQAATARQTAPRKGCSRKGLSEEDLEKIPTVTGKDLVLTSDCAVCLEEITAEQTARMVPGCNHGFHRSCADQWLARNAACPVCRTPVLPQTNDTNPV